MLTEIELRQQYQADLCDPPRIEGLPINLQPDWQKLTFEQWRKVVDQYPTRAAAADDYHGPVLVRLEPQQACYGSVVHAVEWCPNCERNTAHIRISETAIECQDCGNISE